MQNNELLKTPNNPNNYIPKNITNVIKGVAILLMLFHHFFTFPDWYTGTITYGFENVLYFLCGPTRICVGIFCFLTGYFYFFNNNKNYKYSLKKIVNIHINYVSVFIPFLILSLILGCYELSYITIFEFLGMNDQIMVFCWYVWFYFLVMLTMPLFVKAENKHVLWGVLLGFVLPMLICGIYSRYIHLNSSLLYAAGHEYTTFYCVVIIGYMCAKYNIFNKVFDRIFKAKVKSKVLIFFINLFLIIFSFLGKNFLPGVYYGFLGLNLDVVYVPLFIYGLVNIALLIKNEKFLIPLQFLGKYSLTMWFVHCVFFNCLSVYTQQILYLPKNIILVYIWGTLITLLVAYLIELPVKQFTKFINNRVFK